MTQYTHTPAPWTVSHYNSAAPHEFTIMGAKGGQIVESGEGFCNAADARLIAAAPEMLEALRNARSQLIAFGGDVNTGDAIQKAVLDQVNSALSKAQA